MLRGVFAGLTAISFGVTSSKAAPPLSAYGKFPAIESVVLSPDGKAFAYVSVEPDKRRLLAETVQGAPLQAVSLGRMKTRYLKWAGDDHILIFVSTTLHHRASDGYEYEMMSAVSLNLKTGKTVELLAKGTTALGNILGYYGSTEAAGHCFGYFKSQQFGGSSLFKVDLDDGAATRVGDTDVHAYDWVLDDQGRIVARSAFTGQPRAEDGPASGIGSASADEQRDQSASEKAQSGSLRTPRHHRHGSGGRRSVAPRVLAGKKLEMSRSYYYRALEVALMIIDGRRISLEMLDGDVSLDTFIVNFKTIFEAYLRQVLQSAAPEGLIVRGGNVEGKKRLFDDTRVHEAEPDIVVIKRDTGRKVIAEVKYKDKPNRDDINQAIVHAHSYRCNHVIPVHLNRHGAPTGPRHIGKMKGVTFQSYAFDLGATALEIEEEAFARYVFDLLPADPGA